MQKGLQRMTAKKWGRNIRNISFFSYAQGPKKKKKKMRQRHKDVNSLKTKALVLYLLPILKEVPPFLPQT